MAAIKAVHKSSIKPLVTSWPTVWTQHGQQPANEVKKKKKRQLQADLNITYISPIYN